MDANDIFNLTQELIGTLTGDGECSKEEVLPIAYMVIKAALSIGRWAEVNNMPDPSNGEEAIALLLKFISDKDAEDDEFLDKVNDALNSITPTIEKLKGQHGWQDSPTTGDEEEAGD